ncbi:RraA family protein [Candidimonas nitroreducens]|nr:hypothetical protein [Candidimonas nitroreducens]
MVAESPLDRRWKYPAIPSVMQECTQAIDSYVVTGLSRYYVPDIADMVGRMYTVHGIQSLFQPAKAITGTAVTVKCPPGDNLGVKKALMAIDPGNILVVDAQGFTEWCLGGFQMLQRAIRERGLAGLIVHGAYRDASEAQAAGFPIYAKANSAWSGPKTGPFEINVPVCCGGVIVHPGDVMCASGDGIAVVPRAYARTILERLNNKPKSVGGQPDMAALQAQDAATEAYIAAIEQAGLLRRMT